MKILQVMAGAPHGGAETAFVDMCIAMAEAGQEIEVATRANVLRVGQLEGAGLKVHELPFGGPPDLYTPWALQRIIRDFKADIVQTWMARAARKIPKWRGPGAKPYRVFSRLGGYYKLKNFKQTDYFTTITPDIRRYLIDNGIAPERVTHINNFAETERADRPVSRTIHDTPDDAPLLLALGRLHEAKAFDTLLRALKDVPAAYLWIAGEGPDRAALETLCRDLGLDGRVRFLGWRDDRAALFRAADICVFPSRYEPFGTVFVQAWAQKVPLVTTESDGPRQYVRHGEDGLVVPVDDSAALSAAIQRVIDDKALAEKMVSCGYERYSAEFTKENTVSAYLALYREAIEAER